MLQIAVLDFIPARGIVFHKHVWFFQMILDTCKYLSMIANLFSPGNSRLWQDTCHQQRVKRDEQADDYESDAKREVEYGQNEGCTIGTSEK